MSATDWTAVLPEAKRMTAKRVMRTETGVRCCFLPREVVERTEAHVIRVSGSREIEGANGRAFQGTITAELVANPPPELLVMHETAETCPWWIGPPPTRGAEPALRGGRRRAPRRR